MQRTRPPQGVVTRLVASSVGHNTLCRDSGLQLLESAPGRKELYSSAWLYHCLSSSWEISGRLARSRVSGFILPCLTSS